MYVYSHIRKITCHVYHMKTSHVLCIQYLFLQQRDHSAQHLSHARWRPTNDELEHFVKLDFFLNGFKVLVRKVGFVSCTNPTFVGSSGFVFSTIAHANTSNSACSSAVVPGASIATEKGLLPSQMLLTKPTGSEALLSFVFVVPAL